MNAKMTTLNHAPTLTPEQVSELRRLLADSLLTSTQSIFKQGQTVDLMATVWESEEKEGCFDALVSAFQPGVGRLNMKGLSVSAHGRTSDDMVLRVGQLNRRGGITLKDLPVGVEYRLRVPAVMGRSVEPILFLRRTAVSQQGDDPAQFGRSAEPIQFPTPALALAAASEVGRDAIVIDQPRVYESADGTVRATLRQSAAGTTVVAAETNEPSLAGAVVRFAFVQESGKIEHSGTVTLQPVEGEKGLWEGRWEGAVQLTEPCEFVFEVLVSPTEDTTHPPPRED